LPSGADLVVHLLGDAGLAWGEFGFLPASAATGPGSYRPFHGSLGHQGVLELGDRAEDLEEHPPDGGGSVDALVEHHQVDTAGLEALGQVDELFQRPAGGCPGFRRT
jgi:hypothetical protein